MKQVCCKRL